MKKCYAKIAFALAAFMLLPSGLMGCQKEPVISPSVEVQEEESFVTKGSSASMVVETAADLFFEYKDSLWRIDKDTDHMELLRSLEEKEYISAFWVYNNNLYYSVTKTTEYSNSEECGLYKMSLETKREELLTGLPAVPSRIYATEGLLYVEGYNLKKIYKLTEQGTLDGEPQLSETIYALIPEGCTALTDEPLPLFVEQYGYMPVSNGENLVIAERGGENPRSVPNVSANAQKIFTPEEIFTVNQEEGKYICRRIDIETLEQETIFETEYYPTLMQYRNGRLYYMESGDYSLIGANSQFYSVDVESHAVLPVAVLERKPGTGSFYEFYGNFYVTEDTIYSEVIEDYGVYMKRAPLMAGSEPVILKTPLYQSDIKKLGTVEAESVTTPCACGEKTAAELYVERLTLNGNSEPIMAINKVLEKNYRDKLAYNQTDIGADEGWIHDPSYSISTFTSQVGAIHYLDERYLCFQMDGYEYMGGAHGMPYREIFLFDLQTGERLGLEDILETSEEELKTLVSTYFKTLSEKTGFSFSSPEDLEKEIFETVDMASPFYLTREGLVFFRQPYDIAAYAAGFPEVTILFSELRMKIELTNAVGGSGK